MRVENISTPFTSRFRKGEVITCPIAHGEGNFFADEETLKRIEGEGSVIFRYCGEKGAVDPLLLETNPNGSLNAIAGIANSARNVIGFMPHPERASEARVGYVGGDSGLALFESARGQ